MSTSNGLISTALHDYGQRGAATLGNVGEIVRHVAAVLPQFTLACLVLAAPPGPATALFLHRTVRDERGAGLAAATR